MLQPEKLFENYFEDRKITSIRLADFTDHLISSLKGSNAHNDFEAQITRLEATLNSFQQEISATDVNMNKQKNRTLLVDELVSDFRNTMSEAEGVIAMALGGRNSPKLQEFYPKGQTQYSRANRTNMSRLTAVVKDAASRYALEIGEELATKLQSFAGQWQLVRGQQEGQKGKLSTSRVNRNAARRDLEKALMETIYFIGYRNACNVQRCMSYFDFSLLRGKKRKAIVENAEAPENKNGVEDADVMGE